MSTMKSLVPLRPSGTSGRLLLLPGREARWPIAERGRQAAGHDRGSCCPTEHRSWDLRPTGQGVCRRTVTQHTAPSADMALSSAHCTTRPAPASSIPQVAELAAGPQVPRQLCPVKLRITRSAMRIFTVDDLDTDYTREARRPVSHRLVHQ